MAQMSNRAGRVAESIRREIAKVLHQGIKDPRIGMVSITSVDVSRDLSYAKVFFSLLDTEDDIKIKETQTLLNKAAGFFRTHIAKTIKLRITPQLRFIYDESIRRGHHISSLIDSAIANDQRSSQNDDDDDNNK